MGYEIQEMKPTLRARLINWLKKKPAPRPDVEKAFVSEFTMRLVAKNIGPNLLKWESSDLRRKVIDRSITTAEETYALLRDRGLR